MTASLLDYLALTDPAPKGLAEEQAQLVFRRADGTAETREIPPAAARAVHLLLDRLQAGGRVALLEEDRELTPNEAAEILGMSRPLVVRRMENGDLPFHYVGSHRRCRLADVLAFKATADAQRAAIRAMVRHGEELERDYGLDGKAPVLVYDACILYPFLLKDLFVQLAADGLIEARWSDDINDEWTRSLLAARPDLPPDQVHLARRLMEATLPRARVTGHHRHIPLIALPDLDDRHVVAAAIEAGADGILSADRHFRPADLARQGLAIRRPGEVLVGLYNVDPVLLLASLREARSNMTATRPTPAQFTLALRRLGKLGAICDILDRHHDAL